MNLVERLRITLADEAGVDRAGIHIVNTCNEAAEEIERLRHDDEISGRCDWSSDGMTVERHDDVIVAFVDPDAEDLQEQTIELSPAQARQLIMGLASVL